MITILPRLSYVVYILALCRGFQVEHGSRRHWSRTSRQMSTVQPESTTDLQLDTARMDTSGEEEEEEKDNRQYQQRVKAPRTARRLNHAFKYLYRNNDDLNTTDPVEYLETYGGYTREQIHVLSEDFPMLLNLSVSRQLHPKMRFLRETLKVDPLEVKIPPQYFGARLEKILAPKHAFLQYHGLPHGRELATNQTNWQDFLKAGRKSKSFASYCQQWKPSIDSKQIEAFDALFSRGLMSAARDDLVQTNNTWPLDYINISPAEIIQLLIDHGANPLERDFRGVSLLHWACGSGNVEAAEILLRHIPHDDRTERDGATPLHWAAAGATARDFGIGGNVDMCRLLLARDNSKKYVNTLTFDGNSALMWAAWSGTLETVKLLIRNRAEACRSNHNGCTVAHWAASGGSLEVCQYLADTVGVDFSSPNHGGNTPLAHAVAFGRTNIVRWLRDVLVDEESDSMAYSLAQDVVGWTNTVARKKILQLFEDDYFS